MDLQQSILIHDLCSELKGKIINGDTIVRLIISPLPRDKKRMLTMMENALYGNHQDNIRINEKFEAFEVLAMFYTDDLNESDTHYHVTPVDEVLNKVFYKLDRSLQ